MTSARPRHRHPPEPFIPPYVMCAASVVLFLLLGLVMYGAVSAGESYLYHGHDDTDPITDFVIDEKGGGPTYPPYLNSTAHGPQVVEFYAPWCPHCQHYKPQYIQLARDVQATEEGKDVMFYAISCTVHKTICKSASVRGYPTIRFFRVGNMTGTVPGRGGHNFDVDQVLSHLGIPRKAGASASQSKQVKKKKEPTAAEIAARSHIRTHTELYSDAAVSFNFALHHSIYTLHGPLEVEAKNVFRKWLALLHRTLPSTMGPTHRQIDALQMNFDEATSSEKAMLLAIDGIKLDSTKFSLSCTKGNVHNGYTCGLWSMFHIMTVGVAEHNSKQEAGDIDIIPTLDAADSLRNYILHFFGCEECRKNFVASYDNCSEFGRCERLSNEPGTAASWKELALWLWEMHNAVNVRLQRERAKREARPTPTANDVVDVRWPSWKDCPRCWTGSDTWDKEVVYAYLRSEYWPETEMASATSTVEKSNKEGGRAKFLRERIQRIERLAMTHEAEFADVSVVIASNGIVMPLAVAGLVAALWLVRKQKEKNRYGRGKKFDTRNGLPQWRERRGKPRSAGVL